MIVNDHQIHSWGSRLKRAAMRADFRQQAEGVKSRCSKAFQLPLGAKLANRLVPAAMQASASQRSNHADRATAMLRIIIVPLVSLDLVPSVGVQSVMKRDGDTASQQCGGRESAHVIVRQKRRSVAHTTRKRV